MAEDGMAEETRESAGKGGAEPFLLVFGLGYCGEAILRAFQSQGGQGVGTHRAATGEAGRIAFAEAGEWIPRASHVLITAPPSAEGDPVLGRFAAALRTAPRLRWIGYLSSTGVYGDWGGAWVDETTPPRPASPRAVARLAAEEAWRAFGESHAVDIFRLGGIYGPGRSVFAALRAGTARRVIKPGQFFSRIHRDDITAAVLAAMANAPARGVRLFNLVDDLPAPPEAVIEEAARLLGLPPPPALPFEEARTTMSPMALSFWLDNRRVDNRRTKAALGLSWRYPTYREGLAAVLRAESGEESLIEQGKESAAEKSEIFRA
jgi:NAD dependent epimerase/dehydratase family enzyme